MAKGFFDKVKEKGEERLNQLTQEIMANESLMAAIMGTVERVLNTKGYIERKVSVVLNTMNLASRVDVDDLNKKFKNSERHERQMKKKFEILEKKLGEAQAERGALLLRVEEIEKLVLHLEEREKDLEAREALLEKKVEVVGEEVAKEPGAEKEDAEEAKEKPATPRRTRKKSTGKGRSTKQASAG